MKILSLSLSLSGISSFRIFEGAGNDEILWWLR